MDAPTFRSILPEFADVSMYPSGSVDFFIGLGASMLNADRWGDSINYGLALFTAHHLAIAARDQIAAAAGGVGGAVTGPLSSKSVDKVSASYDTAAVSLADAGFWNMTTYGIRLLQLGRMIGAGGIQI